MSDVETTEVKAGASPVYTRVYVALNDLSLDELGQFVEEARHRGADGAAKVSWATGVFGGGVGLYVKVPPLAAATTVQNAEVVDQ